LRYNSGPPTGTTSASGGSRPGFLAAGSRSDRSYIWQRLAGVAPEEHVLAPL